MNLRETIAVVLGLVGVVFFSAEGQGTRYPTGRIGDNCVGEIVWQPIDVGSNPTCGVDITITRINSSFVHIKTCK